MQRVPTAELLICDTSTASLITARGLRRPELGNRNKEPTVSGATRAFHPPSIDSGISIRFSGRELKKVCETNRQELCFCSGRVPEDPALLLTAFLWPYDSHAADTSNLRPPAASLETRTTSAIFVTSRTPVAPPRWPQRFSDLRFKLAVLSSSQTFYLLLFSEMVPQTPHAPQRVLLRTAACGRTKESFPPHRR